MKALYHEGEKGLRGLQYDEVETPEPGKDEVRIKLKAAGLNHRDIFLPDRHDSNEPYVILGSDGAGTVDTLGENVDGLKTGDEVIINPGLNWEKNSAAPPEGFEILGFPDHGTFAEYIIVPKENAVPKPAGLSWEEASVFALSAMTAYRALFTRGNLSSGETVFIPGATGGAGTFLIQFAKARGAKVIISSRSEDKREVALKLGADVAVDSNEDWNDALGGKVDLVIESVGAVTFNKSLDLLKKGGTLVAFGASAGDTIDFNLRKFFYGQFNLLGSTMASAEELDEMLAFSSEHDVKPIVDKTYPLNEFEQAFKDIDEAAMTGKISFVID